MKRNDQQPESQRQRRLPYEPPRVVSEEVFETLALHCGKATVIPACIGSMTS